MRRANLEPPSTTPLPPTPTPTRPANEVPKLSEVRPFQYDGRLSLAALPGLCLALALGGDLVPGVATLGGLLVHALQSGGARRRALVAFLCIFIAVQMSVLYSALPLLWASLYNAFTILLLNMSMVLTGGWCLLHFEVFLQEEPSLAEGIELALFAVFPPVSVAVTCCLLGMLVSAKYIPYSIIVHGFLLLRLFVTPSLPSFHKKHLTSGSPSRTFVLGHAEVSLLLILYVSAPVEFFAVSSVWRLLTPEGAVELLLLFAAPCFLATLLELRTWTDSYGVPYKFLVWFRWASGLAVLFLGSVLLSFTQDSLLIPWLSLTVLSNALLGWTTAQKGPLGHTFKYVCSVAVVTVYVLAVQYGVPWHLTLGSVDLGHLGTVFIVNALLCVAGFLVCGVQNRTLTSALLTAALGVTVYAESFLFEHGLYSKLLMLGTAVSSAYLLVRLLSAGLVGWQCVWLGSALHAFKVPFFLEVLSDKHSGASGSFGIVALTLAITKLVFFERQPDISSKVALGYVLAVPLCLLLSNKGLLQPLLEGFYDGTPTISQTACIIAMLTSLVCLKLTKQHMRQVPVAYKLNLLVLITTGLVFVLRPSGETTQNNASAWLSLISGALAVAILLGIASPDQGPIVMLCTSVIFGLATGLRASELLFALPSKLTVLQYSMSCMACYFILISLWACFEAKRPVLKQPFITPTVCFLGIVGPVTYITELSQVTEASLNLLGSLLTPCLGLYCGITVALALAVRSYLLFVQRRDPFGFTPGRVATFGNVMTVAGCLLACLNCPVEPWEIWNSACSLLLLNLQPEPRLPTAINPKRRTGLVTCACLLNVYSAAALHSGLLSGIGLLPVLEALLLLAILPILVTFARSQLLDDHSPNAEVVIFLTPLGAILFLVGSSYASWLLGCMGLSAGLWLLSERLTLKELI